MATDAARQRRIKRMPIMTSFIGAMLLASLIESAIRYGLSTIRAKRERLRTVREEFRLNERYFQIETDLAFPA